MGSGVCVRVRRRGAVVLSAATLTALTGCSGFLVPAGEGEPDPTPSASGPGIVRAETLPPTPAPAYGAPERTGPTSAPPGECPASGAVVDMGPVETGMMHRAVVLTLTNCGNEPYAVDGYPSVRALGEDGRPLSVEVNEDGSYFGSDPGPKKVVLDPGGTVKSILAWVSTPEGGDLVEGDALAISAAPGLPARVFPLEGHDIRLMDELNTTAWRTELGS
ncbi:DUF4232 domain-containing protein [Streptomyces sp. DH18]|uniref:DUF4232 domain-containing protein n=1 Tax=Streptomyces TaxID=1883 RepID=UPI001E4A7A9F|nr:MULTISPECIES: DUF4232 domain-containing protein [unclassified Streptomyces]MDG9688062.1 DUF4232 domain-containing protein [Streptomyces sp. DH18]